MPYDRGTHPRRRARPLGAPVQELPSAYKLPSHVIARSAGDVAISRTRFYKKLHLCRAGTCPRRVQELPSTYKLVHACCLPLRGLRGDACERRLRRKKRAKRSGGIKAIGKRASPAQTEPLIQQNMSLPYRSHVKNPELRTFTQFGIIFSKEPLNKSAAAVSGSFSATFRFENLEIHKVFLRFSNLNLRQNLSLTALADLFRASLKPRPDPVNQPVNGACRRAEDQNGAGNGKHFRAGTEDNSLCLWSSRTQCFLSNWRRFFRCNSNNSICKASGTMLRSFPF